MKIIVIITFALMLNLWVLTSRMSEQIKEIHYMVDEVICTALEMEIE